MRNLLLLGRVVPLVSIVSSFVFGFLLPDYSLIAQTISEIGEVGSPLFMPWLILDTVINILFLLFVIGIYLFSKQHRLSIIPVVLLFIYVVAQFGLAIFVSPHPWHNMFGACLTFGYISPLMFFLFWKNSLGQTFKTTSLIVFVMMVIGVVLNLNPIFDPLLFSMEFYGLAQRFIVFTFLIYCAYQIGRAHV